MNDCKIKEWLLTEIRITKNRIKEYAECFDGVPVDNKTRIELCKSHIRFCENALKQLDRTLSPADNWFQSLTYKNYRQSVKALCYS